MDVGILLRTISLVLSCLGVLFSSLILLFILICIRPLKSNIPLILTCNTYVTLIVSSIIQCQTSATTVYYTFHKLTSPEIANCQISGYFTYISFGNVFYSLVLHAFYRLARIVYYQKRSWYSLRLFSIGILLQWIVIFLINLLFPLLHYIKYVPSEYRCQVLYDNVPGPLLVLIVEYSIPSNMVFAIHARILRYIRQRNNARRNRHDMVIFKQIIILLVITQCLSMPLIVLWILYDAIRFTTPLSYQIQGVCVALSQLSFPILFAFFAPQIKEKFQWYQRQRQIHPIVQQPGRLELNTIHRKITQPSI